MNLEIQQNGAVPKLALNRVEAAEALSMSPATIDRLTLRGLLRPSRATRRPMYSVVELQRFLRETTAADYVPCQPRAIGLPGQRAKKHGVSPYPKSNFPVVSPSASGEQLNSAEQTSNAEMKL